MNVIRPSLGSSRLRIGIVQTCFTNEIGSKMLEICCRIPKELGVADENTTAATVPDALEVPLVLQSMVVSSQYDVLVAIGVAIRGGTYHFELVSNESGVGVTRVSLDYSTPITNVTLIIENDDQAVVRIEERASDVAKVVVECASPVDLLLEEQFNEGDE